MTRLSLFTLVLAGSLSAMPLQAQTPIVSDSRIKTLVYNENDVYSLLTHYGYQSNIEFGKSEVVQTVSVGDRVAWQIIPAGRRLFIKAMEEKAHTNMTVVTNKRAYQFDLRSSGRTPLHPSEELVYVVRFFYPDGQTVPQGMWQAAPPVTAPQPAQLAPAAAMPSGAGKMNYHYTLSGPDQIAPVQVYDDGRNTYLRFAQGFNRPLQLFSAQPNGGLSPLATNRNARGDYIVNGVQPRLLIQSGGQQVIVYNETMPSV